MRQPGEGQMFTGRAKFGEKLRDKQMVKDKITELGAEDIARRKLEQAKNREQVGFFDIKGRVKEYKAGVAENRQTTEDLKVIARARKQVR